MADQDLTNAINNLQQANEQSSISLEALVQNVSTGQLGTGKFDAQNAEFLRQIEIQMRTNPNLDRKTHNKLLSQIKESLKGNEMTFREKFDRFITNNIKSFGSLSEGVARLFGANTFENRRAEAERQANARERLLREENYNINFLAYKFLVTEQVGEMREQTDLLRILVRRTPSLAQQEEDRMEAKRVRAKSFAMPKDVRLPEEGESLEQGLISRVLEGLMGGVAFSAAPLLTKIKNLKSGLITKVKGSVISFVSKVFGLGKFAKVAGPVGMILGAIETGKDVFDIASAVTSEDIRDKVLAEDIGGVIGSILGGAIGFAVGGPVGAALGVSIGNTIGGYIGGLADKPEVKNAIDDTILVLKQRLESASGEERDRIQKEIDNLEALKKTPAYKKMIEADTALTNAYKKRQEAQAAVDEAYAKGNAKAIAAAELALQNANEEIASAEAEYKKRNAELERKARDASVTLLNTMSSFIDRFANSENVVLSFLGELLGGEKTDQGMLDNTRLRIAEIEESLTGSVNETRRVEMAKLKDKIEKDRKFVEGLRDAKPGTYAFKNKQERIANIRENLKRMQFVASDAFADTIDLGRGNQRNQKLITELERLRGLQVELQQAINRQGQSPSVIQNVTNDTKQFMNQMTTFITDQGDKLSKQLQIGE